MREACEDDMEGGEVLENGGKVEDEWGECKDNGEENIGEEE